MLSTGGHFRVMLAALSVIVLFAAGCGDDDDNGSGSDSGSGSSTAAAEKQPLEGKTIAYIQTFANPYYDGTANGVKGAVESLGGEAKVYQSNFNPATEHANVQNAITQQVDGVVLEPVNAATTKSDLRLLNQADIPTVVLYGYDPSIEGDAAGFLQTEYAGLGDAAGKAMKDLLPSGDVAVITGALGRGDAEGMLDGFKKALGDNSRIVAVQDGKWDRQQAFKNAQDIITKYPDIKGLFVMNEPMAAGALRALGPKAKDITLVSQNGSPEGLTMIEKGTLKATVAWSPVIEGAMATRVLTDTLDGGPLADGEKLCLVPFKLVTADNTGESPSWEPSDTTIQEGLETPCVTS